jgi:glutaconate CoA-transferase, subunit A
MREPRWASLAEVASVVRDGMTIATGGFMVGRAPMALIFELIRQQRAHLHLISLPNPLPAELLVAAGAIDHLEYAFGALTVAGRVRPMPCIRRAIEGGLIRWSEHDGYRIVQRLRAAAMGLPFLPAPGIESSDLAKVDPIRCVRDPFTGSEVAVEAALHPDVALLHARAADDQGNLFFEDPVTDTLAAGASRRVIATAEERVPRLSRVTIPGFQVDRVALEPFGAQPTGCARLYPHDEAHLLRYLELAEAGRESEYLDGVVRSGAAHAESMKRSAA